MPYAVALTRTRRQPLKVALSRSAAVRHGRMRLACQEQLLPGTNLEARSSQLATSASATTGSSSAARGDRRLRPPAARAAPRPAPRGVVMPTVCPETDHFIGDFDPERRRDAVSATCAPQLSA